MEIEEEITAFTDNELKDQIYCRRLEKLISVDKTIKKEYLIQKSIKDLLNSRSVNCNIIPLKKKINENSIRRDKH